MNSYGSLVLLLHKAFLSGCGLLELDHAPQEALGGKTLLYSQVFHFRAVYCADGALPTCGFHRCVITVVPWLIRSVPRTFQLSHHINYEAAARQVLGSSEPARLWHTFDIQVDFDETGSSASCNIECMV